MLNLLSLFTVYDINLHPAWDVPLPIDSWIDNWCQMVGQNLFCFHIGEIETEDVFVDIKIKKY